MKTAVGEITALKIVSHKLSVDTLYSVSSLYCSCYCYEMRQALYDGNKTKDEMKSKSKLSRRDFLRFCAIGSGGVAAWSVFGNRAFGAMLDANSQIGPAARTFNLDRGWLFGGKFNGSGLARTFDEKAYNNVVLPHCVVDLSWQNWDPADWESVWIYRRHFDLPSGFAHARVFLHFDGVMVGTTPVINGHTLPLHLGGYLPSVYEVTDWVKATGNLLAIIVDSRWSNVPPEGAPAGPKSIDYLEPGGIFRSVQLLAVPPVFISDVFAKPVKVLEEDRGLEVSCTLDAANGVEGPVQIEVELLDRNRVVSRETKTLKLEKPGTLETTLTLSGLDDVRLWNVGSPNLYDVVAILSVNGTPIHDYHCRTGFRDARFELDGFFINGERLQIFGLDRHELFPYMGFAMPARTMRRDAEILRQEFNCNMVRCSHYPQSEAFLNACDELGLLVWEEIPGWAYLGDAAWQELLVRDIKDMVIRDRNHPSIIVWGVRVNESPNDPALYRRTKEVAKSLDDSRPTSGTMTGDSIKTWKTEWHQDVLAFDDYRADPNGGVGIRKPVEGVPYLITEAVGQFDYAHPKEGFTVKYRRAGNVEIQESQAIWHAQAHDRAAENPHICGLIAWCGFDYGSLINSYHNLKCPGVADIFRIPKLGASFYRAQMSPDVQSVIEPDFYWDFSEQTPGGPGKKAAIFSNCDRLELYINGHPHSILHPDKTSYANLKHPPFFADFNIDGSDNPVLRIDGYVGEKLKLSRSFSSDRSSDKFFFGADDVEIEGDGSDATRLVFKVVDVFGSPRLFGKGEVKFRIEGPGIIVGDNPFKLEETGGVGAVWLKSKPDASGSVRVIADHSMFGSKTVEVSVRRVQSDPTEL